MTIINSIFKHKFEIRKGTFNDFVNISKNEFWGDNVTIGGNFNEQSIRIDSSVFFNIVCFKNIFVEKELIITDNVEFKSDVFFDSGTLNSVLISGGTFKILNINGGHFKKISFTKNPKINDKIKISLTKDLIIENLYFDFTKIDCKYYLFEGKAGKIYKLELEGLFFKDFLCEFVSMNTPDNLTINNFTNFGNIYFKDVKPDGLIFDDHGFFTIKNSDLGKTTFMSSDFSTMYLDFQGSKITECFISDTSMPYEIKTFLRGDGTITIKDNPEQQRIDYGQLKKIYENRGDSVTALEYYAKEINALLISSKIPVAEKINLCLARISTNHGTDWARGLFSTIICAGICFFFLCLHSNIEPSFTEDGWNFFWNNSLSAFIEFLNPLHKTKDIISILKNIKSDQVKLTWTVSLVGFLSKIFITYFEYQLIQAFRKYGKK